jgi:hypothetical protein
MGEERVFVVSGHPGEICVPGEPGAASRVRVPPAPGMGGRWSTFPLMAGRSAGLLGAW